MNIISVKWGDKYSADYVNQLYRMVRGNTTYDFDFWCYTDDPTGIYPEIKVMPMPDDGLEEWWPKLRMFEQGRFQGECCFFDLDIVIHNSIDDILDLMNEHPTFILATWKGDINKHTTYEEGMLQSHAYNMTINSSCIRWNADNVSHIWEKFWDNPEYYMNKYCGIDRFIYHEDIEFNTFKPGWFYSRLEGIKVEDKATLEYYTYPRAKVCIMNGLHKLKEEHWHAHNPYKGLEKWLI